MVHTLQDSALGQCTKTLPGHVRGLAAPLRLALNSDLYL
jgi:hypothetical protein